MKVEVLVSHWCPTCPAAEAVWRQVAAERDVELAVVDLSRPEGRELAGRLHVRTVPSTVVDGVLRSVGVPTPDEARALVAAAPARSATPRAAIPAAAATRASLRETLALFHGAPHRSFFLLGTVQGVAVMGWWLADLAGRYGGLGASIRWAIPPAYAHGFLLIFGMFPLFVIGFLMVSVPAWTGRRLQRRASDAAAALMALGAMATYVGLAANARMLAAAIAAHVAGWVVAVGALARLAVHDRASDRYAQGLTALLGAGAIGAAAFAVGTTGPADLMPAALHAGVWLFLVPIFLTAEHRLVPFIAGRTIPGYVVFRPRASLPLMIAGAFAHFALDMTGGTAWRWLIDAPMGVWAAVLALRWGLREGLHAPLAAMLHVGLMALALAMALYAIDSLATASGRAGMLGQAPLHLLVVGYMAATTVAMVTRASLGQAGRTLDADAVTKAAFLAILVAAVLRAGADLWFMPTHARTWLSLLAGLLWTVEFIAWAMRYAPLYVRPREDGLPG